MKVSGLKKKDKLEEVILRYKGNVIYVDFVLLSMIDAIEKWYDEYYKFDRYNVVRKSHTFHTLRFYDRKRFNDCKTIGEERIKYLSEVNLYVQSTKED